MRFRRRRRRFGRLALLVGVLLLLVQRRRSERGTGWVPPRAEWPGLARDAAFWSLPFYTPADIAIRLGERFVRRIFG